MPSPTPETSRKQTVLVVDDEPAILEVVELYLGEHYAVTGVTSGAVGVARFEAHPFDVIISDRAMPEMSGNEFAGMIKDRAPEVPIILISGHRGAEVDTTLFSAFLPKPFTKTQLIEAVNDALVAAAA